jgi:DNA-binding MarR family transcriptional regulator
MSATKKTSRFLPEHEDFSYEEFPFYWLARVHAIYSLEMEKVLKKLGTDIPTRRVLLMLRLHGTVSVSELATHAIIKLSTLTRIVQRMRDEGLVETRTNADDARITDVLVTPKGEELTDRIQDATKKIYVKGYTNLTDTQLAKLTQTLQVMFHNFSDG